MSDIVTLYKRNAKGDIVVWQIHKLSPNKLSVSYGLFAHNRHVEIIDVTAKKSDEFTSRINAKRKEGYKALEDLYDNSPSTIPVKGSDINLVTHLNLFNYLNTYLPKYNTTSEGFVLPMLAKTLEDNKPFEKLGPLLGQWKINGLRCLIGAIKNDMDLFDPITLTYHSREGEDWTPKMNWMTPNILPNIGKNLLDMMVEEGACLDGELYLPGYSVNDINSFVKNTSLPQHYKLQYWCYDLACENMTAKTRREFKDNSLKCKHDVIFRTKEEHLNNKEQFVLLPTWMQIDSYDDAIIHRNQFIDLGFEGLILRNPNAEYQFDKRNQAMFKFKKKYDGLFTIVDITEDKRGLPIYTLQNDINNELFQCTINLPQEQQKAQLQMKDYLIGKRGLVEYREKSGVKQVPFHAKLIKIYV